MQAPPPARSSPSVTRTIFRTCRHGGCHDDDDDDGDDGDDDDDNSDICSLC